MLTAEEIKREVVALQEEGGELMAAFRQKRKSTPFEAQYQCWYTRALPLVRRLAPDRYAEFRSYYEIDPRRPHGHWSHAYVIQHYMKGIDPFVGDDYDIHQLTAVCFYNQLIIFDSLLARLDYTLADLEDQLQVGLQAAELEAARSLIKLSARSAGALAGVVLEAHLRRLVRKHRVKLRKQKPRLRDLADALKDAGILDAQAWSQLGWLADIRERCVQKQDVPPTKAQARDLIDGAHWLIKNVF